MASTKPVFQKLGLKPAHRAAQLNVPADAAGALGKPPAECKLEPALTGKFDFVVAFFEAEKEFKAALPKLHRALNPAGMAWICWRKGNVTDLSRDSIHALALESGLEGVSSCAIDDNWSALKLMFPKHRRK